MTQTSESLDLEPRWPILLTILIVFGLSFLPGRLRAFPPWVIFVLTVILLVPMAAIRLSSNKPVGCGLRESSQLSSFYSLLLECSSISKTSSSKWLRHRLELREFNC